MVLLVERLSKLYSKLENHHHHHQSEADVLSASLQAFRSDVSNCLNQLLLLNSEILSFPWIQQCFELLPAINRAFAKLVVEIDYPISSWEVASVDEYLNYGLHLLELLNSVSSSVSHLAHARLSFAHALSLLENSPCLAIKHLKPIHPQISSSSKDYKENSKENKLSASNKGNKGRVVNEALQEIKHIGFWVCGVVLATLSGEAKPYLEMKKQLIPNSSSLLIGVDSYIYNVIVGKAEGLKEVKELNNAAASLASAIVSGKCSDAAKELEKRLGVFQKHLEALGKEVDKLFSKVLGARNQLLHGVPHHKQ
ncbi:hypothetical protein COLO4_12331 [Corchorus olitorius]|uniref:Protein BPS1, chloroplastic-like protein n=1 Tax=Corchorus olitorius TaxID=93759 RepID=A0A1R3K159_9ROSI|nr:hypothetical protein COLO4_12331 [Corchorus olitorius]